MVLLHKEGQEKDTEGEEGGAEQEVAECCHEDKGEEPAEQLEEALEGSVHAASASSGSLPTRSCALAVPGRSRDGARSPPRLGLPKAAAGPALWGHSPFGMVLGLMSPGGARDSPPPSSYADQLSLRHPPAGTALSPCQGSASPRCCRLL